MFDQMTDRLWQQYRRTRDPRLAVRVAAREVIAEAAAASTHAGRPGRSRHRHTAHG